MFALSLATFMVVLDYSIANVSIPYISGDLAVAVDQGTYVITSFAVGNAIALPVTGWLTKKVGAVKLILYLACPIYPVLLGLRFGAKHSNARHLPLLPRTCPQARSSLLVRRY